jgi:hypothetical protein
VDEPRGLAYFTGLKKSSIERQLYRVRLDGSGLERESREDGTHRVLPSFDRRCYIDVHSAHAMLPSLSDRARRQHAKNSHHRAATFPLLVSRPIGGDQSRSHDPGYRPRQARPFAVTRGLRHQTQAKANLTKCLV